MYGTRPTRPAQQVPVSTHPVRRAVGPLPWLAAVAVFFAAVQLAFVVPGSGPAWDETVYVSQVGGNAPAAFFSAPRARGISYLVAPVAALTASTTALRIYLALMSAAALFAALRIWRTVLPTPVLVGAGALFAGLWPTLFYGPAAMPNLWCALGSLAATGWAVRTLRGDPRRAGTTTGPASAVALVALMRPADGFWLALPLMLAAVLVPGRRRPSLCAALAGGLVAGCAPWIAEAYAHYGGLVARLHRAGEIQGGLGWNFAVDDHLRALAGRTLCRPCDIGWESPATAVWWAALPLLTAGGIMAARRAGRGLVALLAAATGISTAVPYLFLVEYAAPRFLLPAYALLALPVAEYLTHVFARTRRARRPAGTVALALVLAAHLGVQLSVLSHVIRTSHATGARFAAVAGALNGMGVRPPCVVSGDDAVPIAYYAGCASRQTGGHDASITPGALRDLARRVPVAVLVTGGGAAPPVTRGSRVVTLPTGRIHLLPGPDAGRSRG
ncbi:hypothetical protein OG725_04415 [Streptomyces sp. NBC_01213]|uniref:Integral membrane protein n=1 Tax=Streptomyces glycanivorans TaxID=3033808 RepID=A0ABY9J9R3_9ACTN|nr:hypothetical protein [Streptomyces sp. Alt3]WLQ62862.1 hypothetical protein P8A20_04325 [Streptomyces sp. Alt3]WSQ76376.1 hypothetical protein OG725_04415 [Streptomyces sp. NBC_01213]